MSQAAEAAGNQKLATRLTELLNGHKFIQALAAINVKTKKKAPRKGEPPRTVNDHNTKAYSEFFEACAKARALAEIEILEATIRRMGADLETARQRIEKASPPPPAKNMEFPL